MDIYIKSILMTPPLLDLVGTICLVNSIRLKPSGAEGIPRHEEETIDAVRPLSVIERESPRLWCWGWGLIMAGFFGQALVTFWV